MGRLFLFIALLVFLGISCMTRTSPSMDDEFAFTGTFGIVDSFGVHQEAMEDIIGNLASPVEIAGLINDIGAPFSKDYLASTSHLSDYNTAFKKAAALGIMGTDLGYLNMYNMSSMVVNYLSAVKSLADDLRVGQFFDFSLLKRLATNSSNLDSLMFMSVRSFNQMDQFLRDNNRGHISSLVIAGLWVEGMYLATQVAKSNPHPDLYNRIGEQKIVITDLVSLLERFDEDPKFAALVQNLHGLKGSFDKVNISYELGEPEMIEKDGMLIFVQNESSHVEMTGEQLMEITETLAKIRNQLIGI